MVIRQNLVLNKYYGSKSNLFRSFPEIGATFIGISETRQGEYASKTAYSPI